MQSSHRSSDESNLARTHPPPTGVGAAAGDALMRSLKGRTELNKLRSQASDRRNSLEELLRRTEAELKDLDITSDSWSSLNSTRVADEDGRSEIEGGD